jgi:hypothetical protein
MSIRRSAAYLIVFVTSACTLVLEIVAGRLLAPFIGVSLYTWTSVIGVVLAGISVGNYVGGRLADRAGSRRTLGVLLVAAGIASLAVLPLVSADVASLVPRRIPLALRILTLTAALFFPPAWSWAWCRRSSSSSRSPTWPAPATWLARSTRGRQWGASWAPS